MQQREQAGGVLPGPLDGVHLPGRGARVLPEGEERGMRPAGGVAGRRPARGALPRPVADLAPELHVGHAVVARRDPAVDGRRRQVHRAAVARRHLLGRQPPAQAVPDGLQPGRRGGLVGVYPAPGRDEDRVGAQLRGPGLVEDVGGGACSRSRGTGRSRCSIAAMPPGAGRPPTGRRRRPRARRAWPSAPSRTCATPPRRSPSRATCPAPSRSPCTTLCTPASSGPCPARAS